MNDTLNIVVMLMYSPQVQLQNMMTSKFVGYFLEEVSNWQKKLATADSVITIWFEVQRTWSHLESIFIGSEDIRAQLPTHSKQFDTIDTDFKVTYYTTQYYKAILESLLPSENVKFFPSGILMSMHAARVTMPKATTEWYIFPV